MSDLGQALETIRRAGKAAGNLTSWRVIGGRPASYGDMPAELDPRLVDALASQGIERLYVHQSLAVREVLAGRNVVVATPSASGKTLCYTLPILDALLRDQGTRALYLSPTKALAHDQLDALQASADALGLGPCVSTYDGDTPGSRRAQVRKKASVLLTNPDMLHAGILPHHTRWREFFAGLRYVVIDEMHQYRGVFGSHVAHVLRRLARIARFYGSQPRFVCCSATIANPVQLAQKLVGAPFALILDHGAPRGRLTFAFYNPPVTDSLLGLRRQAPSEARTLVNSLLAHDVQTVAFVRSRVSAELLLTYLRRDAQRAGRDPATIRGYRGGYLAAERRGIEEGLRNGEVRAVVATNALELGVDIGGLAACVMVGYPGTIASTWQQAGRVGRGTEEGAAILVASSSPLDQYIIHHPGYFFQRSPEHALINPSNPLLLLSHIKCAVFELPFAEGEEYAGQEAAEMLSWLEETGQVWRAGRKWHWASQRYPAGEVSLRTANADNLTILARDGDNARRTIGQLDRASAPRLLHEGAIYLHDGRKYLVESLDWDAGVVMVRPTKVDYYTEASQSRRIRIERVLGQIRHPNLGLAYGEVLITSRVTGYRRLRLGSLEHLGWGQVELPEQQTHTSACWMTVAEHVVARLRDQGWWVGEHIESRGPSWPRQRDRARRRDGYRCRWCGAPERVGRQHHVHHLTPFREFKWMPGKNENHLQANRLSNLITLCPKCHHQAEQNVAVQSTLSGLGRVVGNLLPLFLMCDSRDVSIQSDLKAPQTGLPTIFLIDRIPGGIGLCEQVLSVCGELLDSAAELVRDCLCPAGCPSCIGAAGETNPTAKLQVLRLISALREPDHPLPLEVSRDAEAPRLGDSTPSVAGAQASRSAG